ncbi:MAG: hypothetical protein WC525_02605 [Candidatus Thermoplasmatota archaeon]
MKKIFAVSIILLFLGVSVAPSINMNVVTAAQEDDLIEVTTQACGIQVYGNTTVRLTREQYQSLEEYLVDFRARLNQTSTREEAIPIFKEAVVELDTYGLLPKGMSVERAQKLVTKSYQDKKIINFQEKMLKNSLLIIDNTSNVLCLIAGRTTETIFIPFLARANLIPLLATLAWASVTLTSGRLIIGVILLGLSLIFGITSIMSFLLGNISPLSFSQWIRFGEWISRPGYVNPADGWLSTMGLNGMKTWDHSFHGGIGGDDYLGVMGFTGIKIFFPNLNFVAIPYTAFFLGSALLVNIEEW